MSSGVLYLEPVGGIAGDMFLAAALDLGVPLAELEAPLRTLGVSGWRIARSTAQRHEITGTHVDVVVDTPDEQPPRSLTEISALISASGLPPRAKERALAIFRVIGEAEARIHAVPIEQIHFHEVGAIDSIVDVCAAAMILELLGNPDVYASPPPLGGGTVRIAHGVVPVPVPATLEILRDLPVRFEGLGELTTPTGAALLKVLAKIAPPPTMVVEKVGYGVGTKDWPDRANVLRASLGHAIAPAVRPGQTEALVVLECNLDDCTPQVLGAVLEDLMAKGALDAWVLPAVMKKGRPGHVLSVLASAETREALTELVLRESTTLGVRATAVERIALERRFETVTTPWGEVRMKLGLRGATVLNAAPEFEDCRALAQRHGVPLKEVQAAATSAWRARRSPLRAPPT